MTARAQRMFQRLLSAPAPALVLSLGLALLGASASASPSLAAASPDAAPALENPYVELPRAVGDALVTVRFVAKVQMPGIDTEVDHEITCLAIEPRGLVLCSQALLGGSFDVMARLMGSSSAGIRTLPREIEVVPDDGGSPLDASIIARDSDRDLAWLQLDELTADRRLATVDFAAAAEPAVGSSWYLVRRLPSYLGGAPVVAEGTVAAVIGEPRRLIVPSRPTGWVGSPVFAADGKPLGLAVVQVPPAEDGPSALSRSNRPLPGQAGASEDLIGGVFLPAAEIVRATVLALEVQAADAAESLE